MSEIRFGEWAPAESPVKVEYSLVVIEEIRHQVAEGFQRLSRGGIEVGGILYGTRDGSTVKILAVRPIACEHARGPAFLLSDKDRKALNEQIAADAADPQLEGMVSIGWFLSHTRSDIMLSDSDQEIFSIFFPAPWQVTMVVRPGRGGVMRAGFFVREADGTVNAERSYLDFNFPDRLAGVLAAPGSRLPERLPDRTLPERRMNVMPIGQAAAAAARAEYPRPVEEFQAPNFMPSPPPKKKWPWLLGWAAVVIVAAMFGYKAWIGKPVEEPVGLSVVEREGQLRIEWNRTAHPVSAAVRGTLVINDGKNTRTFALAPRELATGSYTYARETGDVEVRLQVEDADGAKMQEASHFLGQAPVKTDPAELTDLKAKRDELEAEVERLTKENRAQEEKIQELQRTLQIMQARSGK